MVTMKMSDPARFRFNDRVVTPSGLVGVIVLIGQDTADSICVATSAPNSAAAWYMPHELRLAPDNDLSCFGD